ncbi:hypothetical protein [Neisseria elongata]|nr:hypothetical protein [Neisseria elongata]
MRKTCLHCAHADFRDAAAKGMTGFLTCPTVAKRIEWFERKK